MQKPLHRQILSTNTVLDSMIFGDSTVLCYTENYVYSPCFWWRAADLSLNTTYLPQQSATSKTCIKSMSRSMLNHGLLLNISSVGSCTSPWKCKAPWLKCRFDFWVNTPYFTLPSRCLVLCKEIKSILFFTSVTVNQLWFDCLLSEKTSCDIRQSHWAQTV